MSEILPRWPDWMPKAVRSGYGYEPADRTMTTEMDIGTWKRVEFDTDETTFTCSLVLENCEQLPFFESFEQVCLNQGCRWFIMPIQAAGVVKDYKVRFKGRPKIGPLMGLSHTQVSVQFDIGKRDLLDPDVIETLLCFSPAELERIDGDLASAVYGLNGTTILPDYWMQEEI